MTFRNKRADRLQVMLTPEELDALDDWRFTHRMPTRAAAIRELLRRGLSVGNATQPDKRRSRDYAVLEPARRGNGDGSGAKGANGQRGSSPRGNGHDRLA